MDWIKYALEWLKTSPRYFSPIAVVSGIVLFAPEHILEAFGVFQIQLHGQPYLGIVFLFSSSVIVCDLAIKLFSLLQGRYREHRAFYNCKSRLKHLTIKEKEVLRRYLKEETRTQTFNTEDGVVSGLITAGILYPAVKVADIYRFPVNMKFLVWKYLRLHPELVEVSLKNEHKAQ